MAALITLRLQAGVAGDGGLLRNSPRWEATLLLLLLACVCNRDHDAVDCRAAAETGIWLQPSHLATSAEGAAHGSSAAMEAALQAARQALATGEYKASLQHCKAALKAAKQEGKSAYDALCVSGSRAVRMLTKNCSHAVGHTAANSWLLHPLNPLHAMHPRMQPADWPSSDQDL